MLKRLLLAALLLCVLIATGLVLWLSTPYDIERDAVKRALVSDPQVSVTQGVFQVFSPAGIQPDTGVIFYPGGRAAPGSYAPLLRQLATTGVLVVTVPMPLHMALLAHEKADAVMRMFPEIKYWYLAGHSLGGVAAVEYAAANSHRLSGLVLWAAYPARDISGLEIPVLSVYGSGDTMTTVEDVEGRSHWLPEHTEYVLIDADHWQFGHFARDTGPGDQRAARRRSQSEIIEATRSFIAPGR